MISPYAFPGMLSEVKANLYIRPNIASPEFKFIRKMLVEEVCAKLHISHELFRGRYRGHDIVPYRQVFCYLLAKRKVNLKVIGALIGNVHHSTIIHSREKVAGVLENPFADPIIAGAYRRMMEEDIRLIFDRYLNRTV